MAGSSPRLNSDVFSKAYMSNHGKRIVGIARVSDTGQDVASNSSLRLSDPQSASILLLHP